MARVKELGSGRLLGFPSDLAGRVDVCCRAAAEREERGEYEAACEILSAVWGGPGTTPNISRLPEIQAAKVLLRAGSLTAWLGSKRQIEGWQECARDLLSESSARFDSAGDLAGWGEAQKHLALCYWRVGSFDEARVIGCEAVSRIEQAGLFDDTWLLLKLNIALIDWSERKYQDALEVYAEVAPRVGQSSDLVKGHFHNGLGLARKSTGATDQAIIELTAATFYFEHAGYTRGRILAHINIANLFLLSGAFSDTHDHLQRAEKLARGIGDELHIAHAKDSRALAYLEEGKNEAAEVCARESVHILERGDESDFLVKSLVTQARALSRLRDSQALSVYARAHEVASQKVGSEAAARVAMEMIGELAGQACLRSHLGIDDAVNTFEGSVIEAALRQTKGKIGEAAVLVGLKPSTLSLILKTRHPDLRPNPERKRRQQTRIKEK